jgi:predicted ATPase/DNA-binding SARP family transcriptional activator
MSPRLALYVLGPPKFELDHTPVEIDRRKALALVAYLAVNREAYTREYLSTLLWPDYDQEKAFTNLRHLLWETQQALGDGWIDARRESIGLIPEADIWLDVARFETLLKESQAQEDRSLRIPLELDAVQMYRNHFLTGFSLKDAPGFNEWAFAESENLRYQLANALAILSDDLCSLGQADAAIPYARRRVALDPLNEASHRQLMEIQIEAGQHNAALKQYQSCEKILRTELGVGPQTETRVLYKQIRKGEIKPRRPVKQIATSTPQHNLPLQLSKFIGREKELDEITNLIANHRLVTLTGTGGIGKTRLSLKVGEQILNNYGDGIWLVELASLNDPALLPQTVAKLFNLVEQAEELLIEKLIRVLRPKNILLILDNCEHLLVACSHLADPLLENCPNLTILATSRELLGITGEALYHVPPLGLPEVQQVLEKLLEYESVQLFEERARLVHEHFSLTAENALSIAQICQRLDGIPLAIELAAARVNILSPQQIAARLDVSFNLLTGGSRTALPRHQTLHASIDWSWNLLSEVEQILLRRLSVFAGGWTLDASEAVCATNGIELQQVVKGMTHLVTKSLVVVNQDAGHERRYRLLEMIREYAREKLAEADEAKHVHDRHLKYFLKLSEQIEPGLVGPEQTEWSSRTNDERDNLRAALEHAARVDVEAGLYISGRLEYFWESFDSREGTRWLAEFLQRPESKEYPLARAKALYAQGWLLYRFEHFDEAQTVTEECLTLYRAGGDPHGEVDALTLLGFILGPAKSLDVIQEAIHLAKSLGDLRRQAMALNIRGWDHRDFKRVFAYWQQAITLYRQAGDWRHLADNLSELGFFLLLDGKIESAQERLDESSLLYQQLNTKTRKGHLLTAYGQIALLRGDYEQARDYFQQNARISIESGSQMDYLWATVRLGFVELREGNIAEARQIFAETARSFQQDGNHIGIVVALEWMASLYVVVGKSEYAARLIGWADATRRVIRDTRPVLEQADVDRDIAAVVSRIGRDAFDKAYHQGHAMTLDEAVGYALDGG